MAPEKTTCIEPKTIGAATKPSSDVASGERIVQPSRQWKNFLLAVGVLAICFSLPLVRMAHFAWGNQLDSYILLVPFICWYLVSQKKPHALVDSQPWGGAGIAFLVAGAGAVGYYLFVRFAGESFETEDAMALMMLAFFFFFSGAALILLGRETIRTLAFPLGLMALIVPIPVFARESIETFLQYGSAYVADGLFRISRVPFYREDLVFHLPGTSILVAPECSGIHSTLILFITSLLAGYLFLRTPWKRTILVAVVLPMGLLRNGFRVFIIGQLCVHYGPQMIDSPIHRKGGPLFFVLSLIPFLALLAWLYKAEQQQAKPVKV